MPNFLYLNDNLQEFLIYILLHDPFLMMICL